MLTVAGCRDIIYIETKQIKNNDKELTTMKFKNKKEQLAFIKKQTNIELEKDKNNCLNGKKNLLHTEIDKNIRHTVLSVFEKYNIRYESHLKDSYFVYVK